MIIAFLEYLETQSKLNKHLWLHDSMTRKHKSMLVFYRLYSEYNYTTKFFCSNSVQERS